jgi:tRNA 2-selenouridine synthase
VQIAIEDLALKPCEFDELIDVRSPQEYAADHLPGAVNAPVLSDDERIEIGTLHAQSSFDAKKRGAALVARNIAHALEFRFMDRPRGWRPLIYCWRGGNRSAAMATVMERIGWRPAVLTGGYAAYRRFVVADLEKIVQQLPFVVICGVTGSGKSVYLRQLAAEGEQVLDLEMLAHHRGSLLGSEPEGQQPTQKMFESRIWDVLRKVRADRPIYVESESKKIGAVQVPQALMAKMRESPCVELAPSIEERVRFLCKDYAHFFERSEALLASLEKLRSLVGSDRLHAWRASIAAKDWEALVASLLEHHYDPSYRRSMEKNYRQYGSAKTVAHHPGLSESLTTE